MCVFITAACNTNSTWINHKFLFVFQKLWLNDLNWSSLQGIKETKIEFTVFGPVCRDVEILWIHTDATHTVGVDIHLQRFLNLGYWMDSITVSYIFIVKRHFCYSTQSWGYMRTLSGDIGFPEHYQESWLWTALHNCFFFREFVVDQSHFLKCPAVI